MTRFGLAMRPKLQSIFIVWCAGWIPGIASELIRDPARGIRANSGSIVTLEATHQLPLHLSHFIASKGSSIRLKGKRDLRFVINVSGDFDVSGAVLTLEGGLLPSDVFFNLTSTTPGTRRRIAGNSKFQGGIVSSGAPLAISNSTINGRRVSGTIERAVIVPLNPPPRPRGPVGP